MLEPESRVVLLSELRPPEGFRLDGAVATTFTLSLIAAIVPPLAFASTELQGASDPIAALEAVRASASRMDIFCQVGQIGVPTNAPDLVAFLEEMVHEVRAPRPGFLFHPKFWALRFVDDYGEARYRLVVLTRNLTDDHAWDVAIRLDGKARGGTKPLNRPIAELIQALPRLTVHTPLAPERQDRISSLAEEIRRVEWDGIEGVSLDAFHVLGIPWIKPKPIDFSGYKHLVISPFVTDAGLDIVTGGRPSAAITVVSRVHHLDQLSKEWAQAISSFQLVASAALDESDEARSGNEPLAGLHAKVYIAERNRRAHIFMGSANATGPAFGGNVEILVEMSGGTTKVGVERILGEPGDRKSLRAMLEGYQAAGGAEETDRDSAQRELDSVVRAIAGIRHVVTVDSDRAPYALVVTTGERVPLPEGYRASLRLLTVPGHAHRVTPGGTAPLDVTLPGVSLADITPFLVWEVTGAASIPPRSTVVRAELKNEPIGRLDEVLARQIDSPEKFIRFVSLLLGFAGSDGGANGNGLMGDRSGNAFFGNGGPGMFEMVVRALADRPKAIADLDSLVVRLEATKQGRDIVGDDFLELWQVVRQAAGLPDGVADA